MLTETRPTLYISSSLQIWHRYARELGDNGQQADRCVTLWIAPEVRGNGAEVLYLTTNGVPVVLGWLDGDEIEWGDETAEWRDLPEWAWIHEAIEAEI